MFVCIGSFEKRLELSRSFFASGPILSYPPQRGVWWHSDLDFSNFYHFDWRWGCAIYGVFLLADATDR